MALQGPHQVAKQSRTITPGEERAVRKEESLLGFIVSVLLDEEEGGFGERRRQFGDIERMYGGKGERSVKE